MTGADIILVVLGLAAVGFDLTLALIVNGNIPA